MFFIKPIFSPSLDGESRISEGRDVSREVREFKKGATKVNFVFFLKCLDLVTSTPQH